MPKLTKRFVDSLKATEADQVVFDDVVPGFGVRIMPSGMRSYLVQYRNAQHRSRRLTIGKHGALTVDQARDHARKILEAVRNGRDPAAEKFAFLRAPTVDELLDRYLTEHVEQRNRASTVAEVRRLVDKHIRPRLGTHKAAGVTIRDVEAMHRAMRDTPRQANFALAVASKAFALAETWQLRPGGSNPCRGIIRYPEEQRERFLSGEELVRLGETLRMAMSEGLPWSDKLKPSKHHPKPENRRAVYPRVTAAAIELLLYTGCRLSEILNLEWSRVDLVDNLLTLSETKAGKPQRVVINAAARRVLLELSPPVGKKGRWVLPSRDDPKLPLSKSAIEQAWQRIRVITKIPDVHLHDLRHTLGTYAGQVATNAFMVRDLLRHRTMAMTGRYVHVDDPIRALSDQVGKRIEAGLSGLKTAQVIEMRRG